MKRTKLILVALLLLLVLQTAALADERAEEYLSTYYGITFRDEVTLEDYNNALEVLGAEPLTGEVLTLADAIAGAVRLSEMEELAFTFKSENSSGGLNHENFSAEEKYIPYIACALDLGLINNPDSDFSGPVSQQTAASLLYRGAELSGKARHYIGRLSDAAILTKVKGMLDTIIIFDNEALNDAGINILVSDAATGYSLKYAGYDADFLEEYTLRYGHDNKTHLLQLIALLKDKGFDAWLQIEPKVSVYEYLLEWGDPKPPSPTYDVNEMMEGRYFAFSLEYELVLEFDSAEEKEGFHELIETYAKKYDDRVDTDGNPMEGLIYQSWWQPLYYSMTEMENKEFMPLTYNLIAGADSSFSIGTIGLPEQSGPIKEAATVIHPDLQTTERTIYVNPAFYRYITDSDYQ